MRRAVVSRRAVLAGASAALAVTSAEWARAHNGINHNPVTHEVEVSGFAFDPAMLAVRVGDSIRWTNRDVAPHTATARDGTWDTGTLGQGESTEVEVTMEMAGEYYCRFHPVMVGSLDVSEPD